MRAGYEGLHTRRGEKEKCAVSITVTIFILVHDQDGDFSCV